MPHTTDLLVRPVTDSATGQSSTVITPETAHWNHVGFEFHQLDAQTNWEHAANDREQCIVVLSGIIDVHLQAGTQEGDLTQFTGIGGRRSVFDGAGHSVYIPAGVGFAIQSRGEAEIAVCSAPKAEGASKRVPPRHIPPEAVSYEKRGVSNNVRHVYNILPETDPADNLLVVEVVTPSGCWSSYPPHKHDTATQGEETALEEVYFYKINPDQGFAFQRVYTDARDIDETMAPQNNDSVLVPRGYHPVGAPHGYDVYYLNVMAGEHRRWQFRNDPAHEWIIARDKKS